MNRFLYLKNFYFQLRETIFNFAQKELAPHAQDIDKQNQFKLVFHVMFSKYNEICFTSLN